MNHTEKGKHLMTPNLVTKMGRPTSAANCVSQDVYSTSGIDVHWVNIENNDNNMGARIPHDKR